MQHYRRLVARALAGALLIPLFFALPSEAAAGFGTALGRTLGRSAARTGIRRGAGSIAGRTVGNVGRSRFGTRMGGRVGTRFGGRTVGNVSRTGTSRFGGSVVPTFGRSGRSPVLSAGRRGGSGVGRGGGRTGGSGVRGGGRTGGSGSGRGGGGSSGGGAGGTGGGGGGGVSSSAPIPPGGNRAGGSSGVLGQGTGSAVTGPRSFDDLVAAGYSPNQATRILRNSQRAANRGVRPHGGPRVRGPAVTPAVHAVTKAGLPQKGKIRYIAPDSWVKGTQLPTGRLNGKTGYLDKYGNVWAKGPSRTAGERLEWDVQLGQATAGLRQFARNTGRGDYVNVSMAGQITH